MLTYVSYLKDRYMSEKAQGIVEYALLLAFVVVVAGVLIGDASTDTDTGLAGSINSIFNNVKSILDNVKS